MYQPILFQYYDQSLAMDLGAFGCTAHECMITFQRCLIWYYSGSSHHDDDDTISQIEESICKASARFFQAN